MSHVLTEEIERSDELVRSDLRALMKAYAGHLPVQRVAVVGNAPLTPDPARAAMIDDCDLVIRCNSFVLDQGEEAFSGRVTHVVVLNNGTRITPSVFAGYSGRLYFRSAPGAVYRRKPSVPMPAVDLWPEDLGAIAVPNRAVDGPLRELIASAAPDDPQQFVVPTTGMVACWLAHQLFPEARLRLTGFSSVTVGTQAQWHHHGRADGGPVPVSTAHKIDAEGFVLRQWISGGRAEHLP
jgi:hypothetical protein